MASSSSSSSSSSSGATTGRARVVIADPVGEELLDGLAAMGLSATSPDKSLAPEDLAAQLEHATILVVGDSPVLRGALDRAPQLSLIARIGQGPGKVDIKAASERGIIVTHTPSHDAQARAERVLTVIGMLDAGLGGMHEDAPRAHVPGRGLAQSGLGIAGNGPASVRLAMAAAALGMRVRAWAPELTTARASEMGAGLVDGLDTLIRKSDVVCLMDPEAHLTTEQIEALKVGAQLVIAHRVALDTAALAGRLEIGSLRVAVLHDAVDEATAATLAERGALMLDAAALDTAQSRRTAALMATASVRELLRHQLPSHALNLTDPARVKTLLVIRHSTDADGMTAVFSQLKDAGIKVAEIDNRVFTGHAMAITRLHVSAPPSPVVLSRLRGTGGINAVDVIAS